MNQAIVVCPSCHGENSFDDPVCRHCSAKLQLEATQCTGLAAGTRLINQRFEIKKRLGVGGMGEVYLCFDERLSRKVALKRISAEKDDNESRARFLREARVASQLDHSNICPIYEIYEEERNQYIVMQYVDGVTLDSIRRHQKLNHNQIIDIALQVCQGMQAAHENGVVHRDIKAANIMIDRQGRVKILDFGLAKLYQPQLLRSGGETVPMTEKGMVIGTVTHMSPEQAKGEELDERTDIFSFGVVLYELLEGDNPFWNRDAITTLYHIINTEPSYPQELPPCLKEILAGCLEKNRKKRIASFTELGEKLSDCQGRLIHSGDKAGHTEILRGDEVEVIKKAIHSSDGNQDLKDIVYRINRFKATTSPIFSARRNRKTLLLAGGILAVLLLLFWWFASSGEEAVSAVDEDLVLVLVEPFSVVSPARNHGEQLSELVAFALNQHPGMAAVMPGWFGDGSLVLAALKDEKVNDIKALNRTVGTIFVLEGQLSFSEGSVLIRARLRQRGKASEPMEVTLTGSGYSSLLSHQVKALCERVARRVLGDTPQALATNISLTALFGRDWEKCVAFFDAQKWYRRLEYGRAEALLGPLHFMPFARYLQAEIAFFNGRNNESMDIVRSMLPNLEQLPPNLSLLVRAINHRLRTEPDLEVELLKELAARNPLDVYTQYRLGEAFFHTGDASSAIPYYHAALELDSTFQPALNHIAYCYAYQGRHGKALDFFEKYNQLDQSANSYDSFGDGYFYAGNLETAEAFKKNAMNRAPGEIDWALLTLADIATLKADYSAADTAADRYAARSGEGEKNQKLSESLTKKAWIRIVMGRYEAAMTFLDRALSLYDVDALDSHCRETHWLRGWTLILLGRSREAQKEQEWLDTQVSKHQLSPKRFSPLLKYSHHLRAMISIAQGDEDEAGKELRRILDYGERLNYWTTYYNQSFFHCELIRFLIGQNELDAAQQEMVVAARFNPRYPPLLWLRLRLARMLKQDEDTLRRELQDVMGQGAGKDAPPPILMN